MVKLAANYSRGLIEFIANQDEAMIGLSRVKRKAQELKVDFIKLSRAEKLESELKHAHKYRPCLLHHLPHLGKPTKFWEKFDFKTFKRQIAMSGTPHLSIHLDAYKNEVGNLSNQELMTLLVTNFRLIRKQIPKMLLVENVDHEPYPYPNMTGVERFHELFTTDFMGNFLVEARTNLLLDLAHAQCASQYLGVDPRTYLLSLPLSKIKEIHVSGAREIENQLQDAHYSLEKNDYQLLRWVLDRQIPKVVTLEYGGTGKLFETAEKNNPVELKQQLQALDELLEDYRQGFVLRR